MMAPFKTLILTVASIILSGSCLALPVRVASDSHVLFPIHIERNLNELGWYRGAFENGIISFYYAEPMMAAEMPEPKTSDPRQSDVKMNLSAKRLEERKEEEEEDDAANEFCSKRRSVAYPAAAIPGAKMTSRAAKVAAAIVATSVDGTSVDSTHIDATSATISASSLLTSPLSGGVGNLITVRKPMLSFAQ